MNRRYITEIKMETCHDSSYISSLPVVKYLNEARRLSFDADVTFLAGENGTGKSTLIEAIAVCAGYNAEGGSRNFNFSTKQTTSNLHEYIKVAKRSREKDGFFLRAESFYNVASQVDEMALSGGYGGKSLHEQSHGESFLSLVQYRFHGNGLYILDEPESALSPLRQMSLLIEMDRLVKDNSQFIIATHSPILLAFPNALIYQLTESGVESVEYEQCEHYKLTKQFLSNPRSFLKHLFDEPEEDE
ncbi:MAG: AAA family ATPase [Clostridiales bacterium]|jgi:predicted ATPase|nr:AAA family ATPase [Clostridiales bacterium]